jgi:hypothetical protein
VRKEQPDKDGQLLRIGEQGNTGIKMKNPGAEIPNTPAHE